MLEILLFLLGVLKILVLTILSIIGIVLCLVIIVVLIVLHTPIRHKIIFRYIKEKNYLYLHFKLNYFFKLIEFDFRFQDNEPNMKIKIIKNKKEDVKDEQKEKNFSEKTSKKKRANGDSSEKHRNKNVLSKEKDCGANTKSTRKEKSEKATQKRGETTSKGKTVKGKQKDSSSKEGSENKKCSKSNNNNDKNNNGNTEKSGHNTKTAGERFHDLLEKLQEIDYAIWLFTDYKIKKYLKKTIVNVFKIFKLETTVFYGKYGTDNYEALGKSIAIFYVIKGWCGLENFTLEGDFKKETLDLAFYSKGKIKLYTIVYPAIALCYYVAKAELKRRKITFKTIFNSLIKKIHNKIKKKNKKEKIKQ